MKGQSRYRRLQLPLLGNITSEPVTNNSFQIRIKIRCKITISLDLGVFYERGVIETDDDGRAHFSIATYDDDIALQNNETVRLRFEAFNTQFTEELENAGEFIRDTAYVHIVDNDGEL